MTNYNQTPIEKVTKIVELTEEGEFRPDIARQIELTVGTVYKYQKMFKLV